MEACCLKASIENDDQAACVFFATIESFVFPGVSAQFEVASQLGFDFTRAFSRHDFKAGFVLVLSDELINEIENLVDFFTV